MLSIMRSSVHETCNGLREVRIGCDKPTQACYCVTYLIIIFDWKPQKYWPLRGHLFQCGESCWARKMLCVRGKKINDLFSRRYIRLHPQTLHSWGLPKLLKWKGTSSLPKMEELDRSAVFFLSTFRLYPRLSRKCRLYLQYLGTN